MSVFDDYDNYDKKLNLSEGIEHVRENKPEDKKKVEGYQPNPQDEKYYEVMGIKNSFDNVSVGSDRYGQMLISVNTLKEPGEVTLDSDKKLMKGPRRKKKIEAFGDFYTNLFSNTHGAFAFRADRNISDIRMMTEFERIAKKRVTKEQRDAMPLLRLEEDKALLSEMRGKGASGNDDFYERQQLERRVLKETEYRDRFMARLRKARRKTYDNGEEEEQKDILKTLMTAEEGSDDDTNDNDGTDDMIDEIDDIMDGIDETDEILDDTEISASRSD